MSDFGELEGLIQPQHLTDDAIARYGEAFRSHPAKMTVIDDFLVEPVAEQVSRFLDKDAIFANDYGLYSTGASRVGGDAFVEAEDDDRFYRFRSMVGVDIEAGLSDTTFAYMQVRRSLGSADGSRYFAAISGLDLAAESDDFKPHRMEAGDYLRPHNDANNNRQLAIVIYLSPGWTPEYGGTLVVLDRDGGSHTVPAAYNSVVMFDVVAHKHHFVETIEEAAGERARLTLGGWYHFPEPAEA
jgi:hypothetical protein